MGATVSFSGKVSTAGAAAGGSGMVFVVSSGTSRASLSWSHTSAWKWRLDIVPMSTVYLEWWRSGPKLWGQGFSKFQLPCLLKRENTDCTRNAYSPVMRLFHTPVMIIPITRFILRKWTWINVPTNFLQWLLLRRFWLVRSWSSRRCFRDSRCAVIDSFLLLLSEGSIPLPTDSYYLRSVTMDYGIETCEIFWNHRPFVQNLSHHHHTLEG